MNFEKEELKITGTDDFDFSTLHKYTKLKKLCWDCPLLTCLPELPATLTYLDCHNCPLLTCLRELPATLTYLNCRDCPLLTCLPELPATLTKLWCSECPLLTCLPELPATLTKLLCSQEYFIDKYDYTIDSSNIEKYRNDPITEERRERNGMFNIVFK